MTRRSTLLAGIALSAAPLCAQQPPRAIFTDPPHDAKHPARMEVLHIPSGGVRINGVAYLAAGAGRHPAFVFLPLLSTPRPGYDWLQFNGDAQHSGNNTAETIINRDNVAGLRPLFRVLLPDHSDAAPVYLGSVQTGLGMRDLVFITTSNGSLLALDAHSGALFWMRSHDNNDCFVLTNPAFGPCFTTSAPAIDPNRQYVYSYGLDGYVHKHQVEDGSEIQGAGWPAKGVRASFGSPG